ncbi:probable RNA-directed DNA polymerase from transposon X-element [Trichonephila clavipes]|nr:probable RNA-directed DNA polymerase from transposon X-element [Trichonephila clavipes]
MVQNRAVDDAVLNVTEAIRNAADAAIPKTSNLTRKLCKPWWNSSKKEQRGKPKRNKGGRGATKNRLEWTPINFRCRKSLPYNCDFDMWELKRALSSAHNTSPGTVGISYELLRHLNEDSLVSLLYLFNRIWREQVYPTQWQEAIVIPILKPGKGPKNPLSYRPISLTSCLCKTLERMVNTRLIYQLEKNRCIPLFQSGFRKGRSALDNIIMLEGKIRNAFVRRNHLVSIFFDIEKAYDRTLGVMGYFALYLILD